MSAAVENGADPLAISIAALPHSCRRAAATLAYSVWPLREQIVDALTAMADEIHSLRKRMGHALADKDRLQRLAVNRGYDIATSCAEHGKILAEQRDQIGRLVTSLDHAESERKDWVGLVHAVSDFHPSAKPMIEQMSEKIMAARSRRESKRGRLSVTGPADASP